MSYKSDDDKRDKILENIRKKSKKKLDDAMNRQSANIRQFYQNLFIHEINQYEECNKKGDYLRAALHFDFANSINKHLKNLEQNRI
jgi:hypothetical protein